MTDITPISDDVNLHQLPEWADDEHGADGFEWRMVWLLMDVTGHAAISALRAETLAEKRYWQFRERLFDATLAQISKRLPPHPSFASDAKP